MTIIDEWPELTPEEKIYIWLRFRGKLLSRAFRQYHGLSWIIVFLSGMSLIFCDELAVKLGSMPLMIYSGSMLLYNHHK